MSRGKSPKYSEERLFPVFAQKCNLKDGGISLDQARFLDPSTIGKWGDDYKLKSGDVLVNSTGTGTVGRTRLFDECCLGEYPFVVPDSHVSVVRTATEIDSFYIWAILSSNWGQQYLEDNLAGSTNQKELYIGVLEDMFIPLPPKNEQKKIAKEITRWEKYVDNIDVVKAELSNHVKQTKSKILDLAISGKLVPQGPNDEPAIELLKRINPGFKPCDNSHYENLPQGWAVCRLSDMVRIQNGFAFQSAKYIDVGIRIIRITNVQSGYIIDESPKFYPHNLMEGLDEYNLKNGDLLMSLTGNVGRVGIMPENLLPAALNQRVCCLKPKNNDIDKMYLFYYFQAEQFIQDCIASGKGVAQLNVSTEWLKHYIIQLPPKEEQSRIVKTIDALFSIIDKITAEL